MNLDSTSCLDPQLIDKSKTDRIASEAESTTALALQMVYESTQRDILSTTAWTMVSLLLMSRATKMLVQAW